MKSYLYGMHGNVKMSVNWELEITYKGNNMTRVGYEKDSRTYHVVWVPICEGKKEYPVHAGKILKDKSFT